MGIYGQVLGRIRTDKDKSESKTGQETEIGQEWDRNWTNVGQNVDSGQELDKSWGTHIDHQHPITDCKTAFGHETAMYSRKLEKKS